ncbi:23S rRNA (uracil(1939)-C(5))-methyltransferase RlmD [Aliiglaciecola sp. CAU 1673]|uniref:23S rRNA (uracil(1939)-C(5))-methyltransferase RlmD n=1 Tax=Aliiglaciecola sp. CAU 1673 TaxID=3032595 RepID=UPI0023DC432F|nr:23S rRNA (uracil(1939)-C(5))-methyltransferase RlmD [Aliiglaciecola sp. CAU 1673]MDF2178343.1 23S rRNA (uracil(1939)-C(5))-methyltransferase RlmD [Aliiglaciecola sp. CAU 1673]
MVQIYKAPKKPKSKPVGKVSLVIDDMEHGGLGVCRSHQPVVFVEGALPGEQVDVRITEQKSKVWHGIATKVQKASNERIVPFCPHINDCGGCQNQHIGQADLLRHKTKAVGELLSRLGHIDTLPWQAALMGADKGYRRKARLAIDAQRDNDVRIGFRAKASDKVVGIHECQVLTSALQALLPALLPLLKRLKGVKHLGHISLFDADNLLQLCLRVTRPLSEADRNALVDFADKHGCQLLLENNQGQFEHLAGPQGEASYAPMPDISLKVGTNDFVQVNGPLNQAMVAQALSWLDIQPGEKVLDFFCGVGNFSLPMAKQGAQVSGFEGLKPMVERALGNAQAHGLDAQFKQVDLSDSKQLDALIKSIGQVDKILLDPARAGAQALMPYLPRLAPKQVLYVSCNPATFARDAGLLVEKGWRLDRIGLMDMFPGTAHTELMALLVPK